MSQKHRGVPEHVLRAGAAAAAPPGLLAALRSAEATAPLPDPVRRQLWRARWGAVAQLVLVLEVNGAGTAVAAPVTTDPPGADEHSVVLDSGLTVLGCPVTVWGGLAAEIPFFVFDAPLGEVAPAVTTAAEHVPADGQVMLPDGVSVGAPAEPLFSPVAGVRAGLADVLEELRSAAWAPLAVPDGRPLRELLKGHPAVPALMKELAESLGLKTPEVIGLMNGIRAVPPEQVPIIAQIAGLAERDVQSAVAPLPDALVRELGRPRWRKAIRDRVPRGGPEAPVRLAVAYGSLALAARQTGPASADPWPQRIGHYLATHQPDGDST